MQSAIFFLLAAAASWAWGPWFPGPASSTGSGGPVGALVGGPHPWVPDLGNGRYRNPIILADYSDPDVIRVGGDYYLVSSSFTATPALPILHSRDMVNWTIVGHALKNLPHPRFAKVEAGGGVWAPAWGRHAGKFHIFIPLPDDGIYVVTADRPVGPWSDPRLLIAGKGLIDPCPFWDDDGRAYMVHAYAKSRSGIKSKLRLIPMAPDTSRLLGEGAIVFDGTVGQPTIEGPKLYKRQGWYILLAPAGGVKAGWQVALRSRNVWGPYEDRVVLQQGRTAINGPHQGALIDSPNGKTWWFIHFQDQGVYGRVVHLNPVKWVDDWPLMGAAADSGVREPVLEHQKPVAKRGPVAVPRTTDDFAAPALGLQWQWNANHDDRWYSLAARPGFLRLFAQPLGAVELGAAPHLLLQKFPALSFMAETTVQLPQAAVAAGTRAGLVVVGKTHAALMVEWVRPLGEPVGSPTGQGTSGALVTLLVDGQARHSETVAAGPVRLRVSVAEGGLCQFSFSAAAPGAVKAIGEPFQAQPGVWVGARVGIFALRSPGIGTGTAPGGHADFEDFRFAPPR